MTEKEKEDFFYKITVEMSDFGTKNKIVTIEDHDFDGKWTKILDGFLNILRSLGYYLPSSDNEEIIGAILDLRNDDDFVPYDDIDEEEN